MIDLNNTWIKNEEGELRDLYVAEINKQGIKSGTGQYITLLWCNGGSRNSYIEVCDGMAYYPLKSNLSADSKEITLADLKSRVKVEYVKVDPSEAVYWFNSNETLYHEQFAPFGIVLQEYINNLSLGDAELYRKVETEITPMQAAKDACEEFISRSNSISTYSNFNDFIRGFKDSKWNSEFIKTCRTAVNAYDNKG